MRLTYVSNPPLCASPEEEAVLARIQARRGPSGLNELDRTLFHAPLIADGFNAYFKALRTQNGLPPLIRELCFIRVAALLHCWYEWDIHYPIAREAGMDEATAAEVKKGTTGTIAGLDKRGQAVLALADDITLQPSVNDEVFERVRKHFDERSVVELVNSIAAFGALSKIVVTLDIGEKNDTK
jgi:alkylhydroperoxidase family enzyme